MKIVMTVLLLIAYLVSSAQDGMYYYISTKRKDFIISTYNSPTDVRCLVGDSLVKMVMNRTAEPGTYSFYFKNKVRIDAELFVQDDRGAALYDIYIDRVTYPDGSVYIADRFIKP